MVIFNRPDRARQVFARVREARPKKLYLLADGPRPSVPEDEPLCAETRGIAGDVDWDCEVVEVFSDANLGCSGRITSGLERVFGECESAIVLEDDCLPHSTFFRYCEEALNHFRGDDRVFAVTGGKYPCEPRTAPHSYRFSRMFNAWGWAAWRRSWQSIDFSMADYPAFKAERRIESYSRSALETRFFINGFEQASKKEIEPWDWAVMYAAYTRRQLMVMPDRNLVSNTGWGAEGTQQKNPRHILADLPTYPMSFPLRHPPEVAENAVLDRKIYSMIGPLTGPRFVRSIRKRLRRIRRDHYVRGWDKASDRPGGLAP